MLWIERFFAAICNFFADFMDLTSDDVVRIKVEEGLLDQPTPNMENRQTVYRFSR